MAEFTLTDNSANTTTSLLRSLCHYDDSVLMGSWLQETDHKSIEDQVPKIISNILTLKCDTTTVVVLVCPLQKICITFWSVLMLFETAAA